MLYFAHMNTAEFKKILEAEKERLEKEMNSVGRQNPAVPGDWEPAPREIATEADVIDQADLLMTREENAAILADLEARSDQVLAALKRIADGTYGMCEVDGEPIEEKRLMADPAATTCMAHL